MDISTNQNHMNYKNLIIVSFLFIINSGFSNPLISSQSKKNNVFIEQNNVDTITDIHTCQWQFKGHIGQYIDDVAENRILDRDKWNMIYPETEEVFRLRNDDVDYPFAGRWRGEFWGKYILSTVEACRYYEDEELKERIRNAVSGLLATQDDNGYVGTYSNPDFVMGNSWNVWNCKYSLWALVECWELLEDENILKSAKRLADYLLTVIDSEALDIVRTGNYYGMPSSSILKPMILLYNATGDKKYLDFSEYIVRQWAIGNNGLPNILNNGLEGKPVHTWSPEIDPYTWAKGYEFISCVEGLAELYKVTGEKKYLDAAKKIHASLAEWECSPVGSVSFNDKLVGSSGQINSISEMCDAVYWNRLSFALFKLSGDEKYIQAIERTLYNTYLSAFNSEKTWSLLWLRMSHIHIPAQNHFLQHHQCCLDNLPRGLFQAAEAALTYGNGNVYLSLFNEGEGDVVLPSANNVHVKIEGDFLASSKVKVNLSLQKTEQFNFLIRLPHWSKKTTFRINGSKLKTQNSNNWMAINRKWKEGDIIDISFELGIRWEKFDTSKVATAYNNKDFYNKTWANFEYMEGSNEINNHLYSHITGLSVDDALPHKPAVIFFYGPLALSRDKRITGNAIFKPVRNPESLSEVSCNKIPTPKGIWKAFELNLGGDYSLKFCDFSSAGNTWTEESKFNTWCIIQQN